MKRLLATLLVMISLISALPFAAAPTSAAAADGYLNPKTALDSNGYYYKERFVDSENCYALYIYCFINNYFYAAGIFYSKDFYPDDGDPVYLNGKTYYPVGYGGQDPSYTLTDTTINVSIPLYPPYPEEWVQFKVKSNKDLVVAAADSQMWKVGDVLHYSKGIPYSTTPPATIELVKKSDGNWYYVVNGKVDSSKTGLVKHTDGKWYYIQGGVLRWSKTGLVKHTDGKWYFVQKGVVNKSKTGLVKHTDGKWYFVQKGVVNKSKTGLVKHTDGAWYYVKSGVLQWSKTGLVKHTDGKWYYVQGGVLRWGKTGLVKHTDGKWYYVQGGVLRWNKTGLVKHTDGKWYFVQAGKVNFAKTGLLKHTDGKWYFVQKGVINFAKTGLVKHTNGTWYYVQGGKINWSKTGLVKHTNGTWYYVQGGKINWSKTGLVKHTNGQWYYIQKGVINFSKNGAVKHSDNKWYYVLDGKVDQRLKLNTPYYYYNDADRSSLTRVVFTPYYLKFGSFYTNPKYGSEKITVRGITYWGDDWDGSEETYHYKLTTSELLIICPPTPGTDDPPFVTGRLKFRNANELIVTETGGYGSLFKKGTIYFLK